MKTKKHYGIVIFLLLFTACNSDSLPNNLADGGIGGTGVITVGRGDGMAGIRVKDENTSVSQVTVGPITGLKPIVVNGIEYQTDNATIWINGEPQTEDALQLGMMVQIEGLIDQTTQTGMAHTIELNQEVKGPIARIDQTHSQLVILGQLITIDNLTVFSHFTRLDELKIGDILAVSGLRNAEGHILTTHITLIEEASLFEIRGRIHHSDSVTQTLMLGDLVIDYSQLMVFENGSLDETALVNIRGQWDGDQFMAHQLTVENEIWPIEPDTAIDLYGVVTRFNHSSDFDLSYLPMTTTAQTRFIFGTITDIAQNQRLKVKGQLNADNIVVLEEVLFKDRTVHRTAPGDIGIEASVEAIDITNKTITLLGLTIQLNSMTLLSDKQNEPIHFDTIKIGNFIHIRGFIDWNTEQFIAERLQQKILAVTNKVQLEGPINTYDVNTKTLNLLGIDIIVDDNTAYFDAFGQEKRADEFFLRLQEQSHLRIFGRPVGEILIAEEVMKLAE